MKKRVLSVFLCMAMAATVFAGCGSSNESKTEDSSTNTAESSTGDTADTSSNGKKYVIATDTVFAPFEFTNESGEFVGIDVEILDAIAKDQGFEYELQSLGFDSALVAVQSGQADGVIAGMSITDERKETFDFSEAYYDADVTMAVAAGSSVSSLDDLNGKTVAVKTGTNGSDYAKSIADQYGFTITEFKDSPTMYQDVITGNTVACFEDYPVMAYNVQQGAGMEIPDGMTAAGSSYGFAVAKDQNAELLQMFNDGLANIKADGTYQEIIDKYTK